MTFITFIELKTIRGIESHSKQILVVEKKNLNKNDYIVEWNVKARKKDKRKIRNKIIAMKQGVLDDFWFKPISGKFSSKVTP